MSDQWGQQPSWGPESWGQQPTPNQQPQGPQSIPNQQQWGQSFPPNQQPWGQPPIPDQQRWGQSQGYQQGQPYYQQPPQPMMPLQPTQPPKKKNNRNLMIGCGVLIVALIICGVIGLAMSHNGSATANTANTTTPASGTTATTSSKVTPTPTHALVWRTTHTFNGNGSLKTATFTVGSNWQLSWTCDPTSFNGINYNVIISVMNSDGTPLDLVAVNTVCQSGNTSGTTNEHQGGTIYLDINSEAVWGASIQEQQ